MAQATRPQRHAQDPERLHRARFLAGLNQKNAAAAAKISAPHLCRLELGRVGASPELLHTLAAVYGCEIADLMPRETAAS